MDIKQLILEEITKKTKLTTSEITKKTGFSRTYINRFFQQLREEGKIIQFGSTKNAWYALSDLDVLKKLKKETLKFSRSFDNTALHEENVLKKVKQASGIFLDIQETISRMVEYSFLEMVNNAIEHSLGTKVNITIEKNDTEIKFIVSDNGIGIFENIKTRLNLNDHLSAIQELLKGKQTTSPQSHTGQGIFFTSKIADIFTIKSANKILIINNNIDDLFIEDKKTKAGTEIIFILNLQSQKTSQEIFARFTNQEYEFSKTQVKVKLFKIAENLLSRSEARRVMAALDKFQEIILDFQDVKTIGQSFADEIFRVWQDNHPHSKIIRINAGENVEFMIKRAQ